MKSLKRLELDSFVLNLIGLSIAVLNFAKAYEKTTKKTSHKD